HPEAHPRAYRRRRPVRADPRRPRPRRAHRPALRGRQGGRPQPRVRAVHRRDRARHAHQRLLHRHRRPVGLDRRGGAGAHRRHALHPRGLRRRPAARRTDRLRGGRDRCLPRRRHLARLHASQLPGRRRHRRHPGAARRGRGVPRRARLRGHRLHARRLLPPRRRHEQAAHRGRRRRRRAGVRHGVRRRLAAPREGGRGARDRLEHLARPPADPRGEGAALPRGRGQDDRHRDRRRRPPARGAMSRGWLAPGGARPAGAHVRGPHRDLLVTGANVVDVVTQTVFRGWFTVLGGRFVEVEEGDGPRRGEVEARETIDLGGAYVQPGMIDVHMHIESSLVTPRRFAEGALARGTTAVLQDPHEVANVLGAPGITWMVEPSRGLPLRVFSAVSSCVPATSPDIETPNASITPAEVTELAKEPDVLALGEVMDFQGLVAGDDHLSAMVAAAHAAGLSVEGHVPSLSGEALSRYVAFGARSDHTLMTAAKVLEQLRKGQWVMVQEKSVTPEVVAALKALPDRSRVVLITDDVMPHRLLSGQLDRVGSLAVERGWDPVDAIASATLRPATYLGLADLGLVAPGALAAFVVTDGLAAYPPRRVYVGGRLVAADGATVVPSAPSPAPTAPAGLAPAFDPRAPR